MHILKKFDSTDIIRYSVFLIFLGRAYQFFFFGAPFRAIFWDESLLTPFVENLLGISWQEYATDITYSNRIDLATKICGVFLALGAFTSILWNKISYIRIKKLIISVCILILLFTGICIFKDKHYSLLQVFELFIQISIPIVLVLTDFSSKSNQKFIQSFLKVALSITFIAHGLYAMGIPFYPGHFIDMTINITGFTEDQSKVFLTIAGICDILAAILIYFKKTMKYALTYILIWGLLTALARVVAGFNVSIMLDSIHNSLYATIYRLPHGLIALIILLISYSHVQITETKTDAT